MQVGQEAKTRGTKLVVMEWRSGGRKIVTTEAYKPDGRSLGWHFFR